ncbi:hypothetical protein V491_04087, partial [Pseudogymnoascus sp. VKM F-3775]
AVAAGEEAKQQERGERGAEAAEGGCCWCREGEVGGVAEVAEEGGGKDAGDVEEGEEESGGAGGQVCDRGSDDSEGVDVECAVLEEVPWDSASAMMRVLALGDAGRRRWDQEDHRNARSGSDGRPDSQSRTCTIAVEKGPQQKGARRPDDVFARQDDAICDGTVAGVEPFPERESSWAVDERAAYCCQHALRRDEMPDVGAERGEEEAEAGERGAAEGGSAAAVGPAFGEEGEEEGHGEVHDAVGGCADDACDVLAPLQGPVTGIVFLEDAIVHCKPWVIICR